LVTNTILRMAPKVNPKGIRAFLGSRLGFAASALFLGSVGMYTGIAIREENRLKELENLRLEAEIEKRLARRLNEKVETKAR